MNVALDVTPLLRQGHIAPQVEHVVRCEGIVEGLVGGVGPQVRLEAQAFNVVNVLVGDFGVHRLAVPAKHLIGMRQTQQVRTAVDLARVGGHGQQ